MGKNSQKIHGKERVKAQLYQEALHISKEDKKESSKKFGKVLEKKIYKKKMQIPSKCMKMHLITLTFF